MSRPIAVTPEEYLQKKIDHLVEALRFYADKNNWSTTHSFKQFTSIADSDAEYFALPQTSELIAGKRARAALKLWDEN